jgi:septal ring-binding cell division protein DamX/nucleoid DNA-binding protein
MNRDDLLKKCVDRGVADETSVGAVSHLFYVYLLSALQKGQRVEVPNFGTFGTRVVGVKRTRKMPYFEPEREVAGKINERYRSMKYLVIGTYELTPAIESGEYKGKEAPFDATVDQLGKEMLVDTYRDVTVEEYERERAGLQPSKPSEESTHMPRLNLKDEGMEEMQEGTPTVTPAQPRLRGGGDSEGGKSPWVWILLILLLLGLGVVALNYFGVINLWGPGKSPMVVDELPVVEEPLPTPPAEEATPTPTPTPTPAPTTSQAQTRPTLPPSGTGDFTVQISSWITRGKAEEEALRFSNAGYDAFVEEASVFGEKWYRVRVGRYATRADAQTVAQQLQGMLEDGIWVDRIRTR